MKKLLAVAFMVSAASASATGLSATDRTFLANAVRGNNYEIAAAKLALSHSRSAADRQFAMMMINDHTALGSNVKAAVRRADSHYMLPATVTYKQADMLNKLRGAGRHFDALYRQQMVMSHSETYQLFNNYSHMRYANPGLQSVISSAKPTVHQHWNHALSLPRY